MSISLKVEVLKVVPIVKNMYNTCNRNYWPISIVPTISKVYERTMSLQIMKFIQLHGLFYNTNVTHKFLSTFDAVMSLSQNYLDKKVLCCLSIL